MRPHALLFSLIALLLPCVTASQTVQPVVAEFTGRASGSFTVTNTAFSPMAVILEPRSFTIEPDGHALYRPLDATIHLELSVSSLRLGPRESQTVFYRVNADALPAWLTVYATFTPLHPGPGLSVRIMLPHTIYLYSRQHLAEADVQVNSVEFDPELHRITCDLTNQGTAAARADEIEAVADRLSISSPGFPLLPGLSRHLVLQWPYAQVPSQLRLAFAHFTVRRPVRLITGGRP